MSGITDIYECGCGECLAARENIEKESDQVYHLFRKVLQDKVPDGGLNIISIVRGMADLTVSLIHSSIPPEEWPMVMAVTRTHWNSCILQGLVAARTLGQVSPLPRSDEHDENRRATEIAVMESRNCVKH